MLTDAQKRTFKREGYLVLEDGIDTDLVEQGREQILEGMPHDPDDEEALLEAEDNPGAYGEYVDAEEPYRTINERLYEYGRALVGDALVAPDEPDIQLSIRYPNDIRLAEYHERLPDGEYLDGPHLDGYASMPYSGFTVGGVVYFGDVAPRSGGFTVFPRSHWVTAKFFEDNHPDSAGNAGWVPAIDDDGDWDLWDNFWEQARSRQVEGTAGTVILWHNKMIHCAGLNQRSGIRMAGIKRMARHDHEEIKIDAADKPFKYWDIADLDVDLESH